MKIVFFGNTVHSLIGAKIIHKELEISLIVTIPNSPLEQFAKEQKLPCQLVTKLTDEEIARIATVEPDFLVVEDYGLILPTKLLELPKYASLNIHHSLLPKYRGPAPAPAAILAGEKVSGVSVIRMSNRVDAGNIFGQTKYVLKPTETTDSPLNELNLLGGQLAVSVVNNIVENKAVETQQNESEAISTQYMQKTDGFIDLNKLPTAEVFDRMIRAYFPWPGVWSKVFVNADQQKIVKFLPNKMVQVEGKKEMTYKDFINGYPKADKKLVEFLRSEL